MPPSREPSSQRTRQGCRGPGAGREAHCTPEGSLTPAPTRAGSAASPEVPRGAGISLRLRPTPAREFPAPGTGPEPPPPPRSARDSPAIPWSSTLGPSHSQNRLFGPRLGHVSRPHPGRHPRSPDLARRPLTPRVPPLPERPRVGLRPCSAAPGPRQSCLPMKGPVRPSPARAIPRPQLVQRDGNDRRLAKRRGRGRATHGLSAPRGR